MGGVFLEKKSGRECIMRPGIFGDLGKYKKLFPFPRGWGSGPEEMSFDDTPYSSLKGVQENIKRVCDGEEPPKRLIQILNFFDLNSERYQGKGERSLLDESSKIKQGEEKIEDLQPVEDIESPEFLAYYTLKLGRIPTQLDLYTKSGKKEVLYIGSDAWRPSILKYLEKIIENKENRGECGLTDNSCIPLWGAQSALSKLENPTVGDVRDKLKEYGVQIPEIEIKYDMPGIEPMSFGEIAEKLGKKITFSDPPREKSWFENLWGAQEESTESNTFPGIHSEFDPDAAQNCATSAHGNQECTPDPGLGRAVKPLLERMREIGDIVGDADLNLVKEGDSYTVKFKDWIWKDVPEEYIQEQGATAKFCHKCLMVQEVIDENQKTRGVREAWALKTGIHRREDTRRNK